MYASENSILMLMLVNALAVSVFLVTLQWVEEGDKWVHIPLVAVIVAFITSFYVATPYSFMFVYDGVGNKIIYPELGYLYYAAFLIEFLAACGWIAYLLYLKLDWFEGLFGPKKIIKGAF